MARLWTCGFEMNSVRELETVVGNYQFNSAVIRGGAHSLRFNAISAPAYAEHTITAENTAHLRVRAYVYIRNYPTATTPLLLAIDSLDIATASIRMTPEGRLKLYDQLTPVAGESAILDRNTWYRIELWTKSNDPGDTGAEARLDGVVFATDDVLSGGSRWKKLRFGAAPSSENPNPTFDLNFDDIAVNDSSGSFQNEYPGTGTVVHLHPNAAGDSNQWTLTTGGTTGSINNFTRVREQAPDDLTSYNALPGTGSHRDLFNVENISGKGMTSSHVVKAVHVGVCGGSNSTTLGSRIVRLLLASGSGGTRAESGQVPINVDTTSSPFTLNTVDAPHVYQLTSYQRPEGGDWTVSHLDSMQIGYENWFSTGNQLRVTKVWALVEYSDPEIEEHDASAQIDAEASGTAAGTRTSDNGADASASVSGASSGISERSSSAVASAEASGETSETAAGPKIRAESHAGTDSEVVARSTRFVDASGSASVDGSPEALRTSQGDAEHAAGVMASGSGFKTSEHALSDDLTVSRLIGTATEEDLLFPINIRVELDIPGNSWVDITGDVRATDPVQISRGRANEASVADTSSLTLKLNNRHGKYSPRNPMSPYYGKLGRNTPIRVYVQQGDLVMHRFIGEVYEWPSRWDVSDTDVWIDLEANGLLRRLEQGDQPLRSALTRFVLDSNPLTYYPLTNGKESRVQAPALVGRGDYRWHLRVQGTTLSATSPEWQGGDVAPWLEPIVRIPDNRIGISSGPVEPGSGTSWCVDFVRSGTGGTDSFQVVTYDGSVKDTWFIGESPAANPPTIHLTHLSQPDDAGGAIALLFQEAPGNKLFNDDPHHIRLQVTANGSNSDWVLYIDGIQFGAGSRPVPAKPVVSVGYEWWRPTDNEKRLALGHIAVWSQSRAPEVAQFTRAMLGYPGEKAGRRIQRICAENGIALEVNGDLDNTPRTGPQRIENLMTLLRQAEAVDGGILYESRIRNALLYRTNRSRYNQ